MRTLSNVPVQVKYTNETYRPIVVRKIVDVGPDPAQGGATKVLLDGVTPAWGVWKENEEGVPQFEVNQTQSFPGMEEPAEGPLPGDYDLQLVSDSTPTGLSGKDITVIVAAVIGGGGGHRRDRADFPRQAPAAAALTRLPGARPKMLRSRARTRLSVHMRVSSTVRKWSAGLGAVRDRSPAVSASRPP